MPAVIGSIINIIILKHVRSSTHRVHLASTATQNNQHQYISRRDTHVFRHFIIMLCIFIGGTSPFYIYTIVVFQVNFTSITASLLLLLAELCLLFNIINLYLYNHEVRRYLLKHF
jgi:hypothetical protein